VIATESTGYPIWEGHYWTKWVALYLIWLPAGYSFSQLQKGRAVNQLTISGLTFWLWETGHAYDKVNDQGKNEI
jgi:hypothetical protein